MAAIMSQGMAGGAMPSPASSPSIMVHLSPGSGQSDLPVRTACNYCRSKKIKCDKTSPEEGGCARCKREAIECCYEVREPIGRPRKRKADDGSPHSHQSPFVRSTGMIGKPSRRKSGSQARTTTASPFTSTPVSVNMNGNAAWPAQNDAAWTYAVAHASGSSRQDVHAAPPQSHALSPSSQSIYSAPTSSHGVTPSSTTTIDTMRPNEDAPNLSDLGLAAFLESLDTLEINTDDGLTSHMLEGLDGPTLATDELTRQQAGFTRQSPSALSLANVHGSTSYAVPADLSWADPSWLDNMHAQASDRNSVRNPAGTSADKATDLSNRSLLPDSWPRGPGSGMGQGELRTIDGRLIQPAPAADPKVEESDGQGHAETTGAEPCSRRGKSSCCCSSPAIEPASAPLTVHPVTSAESATRVHCVPDPTGRGCTCLCDVSVALINVRTTLRQARDEQSTLTSSIASGSRSLSPGHTSKRAASTLQLTLSASQAVADQCACSASCPTCRTDPSTSLSASLLVSTALQIYVRAVRTLRQGFGAHDGSSTRPLPNSHAAVHASGSEWDVSIGQYKPKAINARRIALFAMKLELRDLRDAIAKVSRAASGANAPTLPGAGNGSATTNNDASCCSARNNAAVQSDSSRGAAYRPPSAGVARPAGLVEGGVNPIDQVVIRKLHQQLGDLLRTVESIEEQQDAERNAVSIDSDCI